MKLNFKEQRMKHDFKYYVENRLYIPYTRKRYNITPLHNKCIETVMENLFTLLMAYRGFGKTDLVSYCFVLWRAEMWGEDSLILSANENLAYLKLDLIRNAIESDNEELRYMYSGDMSNYIWNRGEIHLIDRNKASVREVMNPRTGIVEQKASYGIKAKIYARSLFAISRGIHVDNIILDDGVVEQNSSSFELMQQTKNIFHSAITPIRLPDSRMIVVGTPQSDEDLLMTLRKNPAFKSLIIPALNEKNEPVCPELHSREFINQQRVLVGEMTFQQEYMLRPKSEINTDFTYEILNKCRNFDIKFESYYTKSSKEKIYIGTDFSIKDDPNEAETKDTDYFSLVAIAYNTETNKRRVLAMHRERGLGYSRQIDLAINWYFRFEADGLCTEKHGFLDIFNQIAKAVSSDINIIDTGNNAGKFDKTKGIPSMKWEWERKLWDIPCGDELSLSYCNILFNELNQLGASKHDDVADALFRAAKACLSDNDEADVTYTPSQRAIQSSLQTLNPRVW